MGFKSRMYNVFTGKPLEEGNGVPTTPIEGEKKVNGVPTTPIEGEKKKNNGEQTTPTEGENEPPKVKGEKETPTNAPANPASIGTACKNMTPEECAKLKEEFKKEFEEELKFKNSNPLDRTFADVYKIIAYLCIVIFVALTVITFMDILLYSYDAYSQYSNLNIDSNMFNKDTHDYKVLSYVDTNTTANEPYHVFLCEQIFSIVYLLVGITILFIAFEYGASAFLNFYSAYTGSNKDYSVDIAQSKIYLLVIIVALFGTGILTGIYYTYFINKTQTSMIYIQDNMSNISSLIYQNLTTDNIFLTALVNDDISTIIHQFSTSLKQGIADGDTLEAQKMICTISLYSYFTTSVPLTDMSYNTILDIFNYDNITNKYIDPTKYLYYNNYNINIQNLYPQLISIINTGLENYKGKSIANATISKNIVDPFFGSNNTLAQSKFISNITSELSSITEGITSLSVSGIYDGKKKLFTYLLIVAFIAFVILLLLIGAIWGELPLYIREKIYTGVIYIMNSFKSTLNRIITFILSFMPKKRNSQPPTTI